MPKIPRAFLSERTKQKAREQGKNVTLSPDQARALRELLPLANGILKTHRKAILREVSERQKRLAIVANELDLADAGANLELPVAFYALAFDPQQGL